MLRALIKKELRLAVRSRRVWFALAAMSALSLVAMAGGVVEHLSRRDAFSRLTDYGAVSFQKQKAAHPHQIAHNGYVVARPPAPLGFLDGGVETAYGTYVRLDAHTTRSLQGSRSSELARGPGAGRFDLGLLLAIFAPAVLILLGYDQIAGEKTRGTYDMLRVGGLDPASLLASKLLGLLLRVLIAVMAPSVTAVLFACGIIGEWPLARLALWLAAHALALLVWMLIVLLTSTLARTPQGALLVAFAIWGALALGAPPFAGGLASALRPLPPLGEEMVQAEKWAASAHAQNESLRAQAIRDVQKRHPAWNGTGEAPEVLDAVMLRLADADVAKKVAAVLDVMERDEDEQQELATVASMISPAGLASLASSAIAGSDIAHMRALWRHYEGYRVSLMAWFNDWWAKNGRGGFDQYQTDRTFSAFQDAPKLVQPRFGIRFALRRACLSIVLLLGSVAAVTSLLFGAVRRSLLPRGSRTPARSARAVGPAA
jgi:ABC-2 type transport system permease protein